MSYTYSYISDALSSGLLFGVFSGVPTTLIGIATYVLSALGLYTIAKRRGLNHPWLAWIPVASAWIVGSLSDQYRYVVNGASITKSRQTPKKQQDKYLAHKAFVAYVDARGIRLDARFRRITRRSFGRWGLTWLKIKECGDRETYRLFDLIPVWRKRVTDKQACDGH